MLEKSLLRAVYAVRSVCVSQGTEGVPQYSIRPDCGLRARRNCFMGQGTASPQPLLLGSL